VDQSRDYASEGGGPTDFDSQGAHRISQEEYHKEDETENNKRVLPG
jgi:hypothetical protein